MAQNPTIYIDYAAATPLDSRVLAAMQPYLKNSFYNPSAVYDAARQVRAELEAARRMVGYWLGARSNEIIFTAGGTESDNLAIHGIMRLYPGANLVISAIEHEAVRAPAARYDYRNVAVSDQGLLDMTKLVQAIDDKTVLVSIMYANNEIGTIEPLHDISLLIAIIRKDRRSRGVSLPLYLHSDACQAVNFLDLHVARLGVDLLTLNGGKIYGPKQSGILYVKAGLQLQPLVDGGGQERGLRSGTENVAAAIGFAVALECAQIMRRDEVRRLSRLQQQFFELLEQLVPTGWVNGSRHHRLPNNMHFTIPGYDNERLLLQLDQAGILAAAGSACSASDEAASHVLQAIGLSDADARSSLRLSTGRQTSETEIARVVQVLAALTR